MQPEGRDGAGRRTAVGPGRVVVGVDGSEGAHRALVWALAEAARRGADLEVVAAVAADDRIGAPPPDTRRLDRARADIEQRARKAVDEASGHSVAPWTGDVEVTVTVVAGAAADHLVGIAAPEDLLVVGSRGGGAVEGAVLGSVALRCLLLARGPVVVVPHAWAPRAETAATVVVGFDGSPAARLALAAGLEEAARRGGRVDVVTVVAPPGGWVDVPALTGCSRDEIQERARAAASDAVAELTSSVAAGGPEVDVTALEGAPAAVLVDRARDADLLVVGSRGRATLPGVLLGSVALRCVVGLACPTMVVHPGPDGERPAVTESG